MRKTERVRMGGTAAKESWQVSLQHGEQCSPGLGVSSPFVWVRAKRTRAVGPAGPSVEALGRKWVWKPSQVERCVLREVKAAAGSWVWPQGQGAWNNEKRPVAQSGGPGRPSVWTPRSQEGPRGGGTWSSHIRMLAQTACRPQARGAHAFCGERFSDRGSARALEKQMLWAWLSMASRCCLLQVILVWTRTTGQVALQSSCATASPVSD